MIGGIRKIDPRAVQHRQIAITRVPCEKPAQILPSDPRLVRPSALEDKVITDLTAEPAGPFEQGCWSRGKFSMLASSSIRAWCIRSKIETPVN